MPHFGRTSIGNMRHVRPELILVAGIAIVSSEQDFSFFDGARSKEEQQSNVDSGVSQTMRSAHLIQRDGYAWAGDLVPYVRGRPRWEWGPAYVVARAIHQAATSLRVELRWGGVWDRPFLTLNPDQLEEEVQRYIVRRREKGKRSFIDAPHFQLLEF